MFSSWGSTESTTTRLEFGIHCSYLDAMPGLQNRRLRFTLRTLLLAVTIVAICLALFKDWPPLAEVRQVRRGMSRNQVQYLLGQPINDDRLLRNQGEYMSRPENRSKGSPPENWVYFFDWGQLIVKFPEGKDSCSDINYWRDWESRGYVEPPATAQSAP
jgi:hypothetical protein